METTTVHSSLLSLGVLSVTKVQGRWGSRDMIFWARVLDLACCRQPGMSLASVPLIIHQGALNLTWYIWNIFFKYLYSFPISSGQKENNRVIVSPLKRMFSNSSRSSLYTFSTSNSSSTCKNHLVPRNPSGSLLEIPVPDPPPYPPNSSQTYRIEVSEERPPVDNMLLRWYWSKPIVRTNPQG